MKFSEQWLNEWLDGSVESERLYDRLTMSGLEVDGVETAAAEFSGVVVAQVKSVEPHPDADKLRVCSVDNGDETLQIVCGASNVRPDLKVPLATIGAKLPGDFKIKKSKLRGVESFGMLCSAAELGMVEEADGLMELADDLEVGQDIRRALNLDDQIIELSLTPNRGDCFSIMGIARDVAVFCDVPFKSTEFKQIKSEHDSKRDVILEAVDACPKYTGRVITNVNTQAETPLWMQEKLRRSSIRSISPVVDITNYVMIEMGLPMHAFDNDLLEGSVHVRYAKKNESLTLLDEQEIKLNENSLVIADDNKALALAGIMGGLDSSVTDKTKNIFLECAFFIPEKLIGDARRYGLHTDSSHRFERGVDYEQQLNAINRASELIIDICGGETGPVQEYIDEQNLPQRLAVNLRKPQIHRVLGLEVDDAKVVSIFERLGMKVESNDDGWTVTPPSYRFDIQIEVDLIEELARVIGYDNIEVKPLMASSTVKPESVETKSLKQLRSLLTSKGYYEVITYSFIDPKSTDLFSTTDYITLANPISSDLSVMRTSLIPGLVQALQYNINRQQPRVRLFESGLVFQQAGSLIQTPKLAGIVYGDIEAEQWDKRTSKTDFFDLKNDVEAVLSIFSEPHDVKFIPIEEKSFHPGQTARILLGDKNIGVIGALHPGTQADLGISKPIYAFELDLAAICSEKSIKFVEISKFPSIRRDLSLVLDGTINASHVSDCIEKTASELLKNLELFDVYVGEGIELGKKSLTFGLTFQRSSSTLVDTEVDALIEDILAQLQTEFGATLRE